MPSNLYGMASYDGDSIKIYLNKKRLKESLDYVIEDVMPHEYAHAVVFYKKLNRGKNGHSLEWQKVCQKLEGIRCERFVKSHDIVMGKLKF